MNKYKIHFINGRSQYEFAESHQAFERQIDRFYDRSKIDYYTVEALDVKPIQQGLYGGVDKGIRINPYEKQIKISKEALKDHGPMSLAGMPVYIDPAQEDWDEDERFEEEIDKIVKEQAYSRLNSWFKHG